MKKPLIAILDCQKSKKESLKQLNNHNDINLDDDSEDDDKKQKMEFENKYELS